MNPFQRLGVKISNWWRGEPQDSGGVVTLNSPSFLERIGLKRKGKPTSEVTYFTCLKMLSETLAKMPIKYYQKNRFYSIMLAMTESTRNRIPVFRQRMGLSEEKTGQFNRCQKN